MMSEQDRERFENMPPEKISRLLKHYMHLYRERKNLSDDESLFLSTFGFTKRKVDMLSPALMASVIIKMFEPHPVLMVHTKKDTRIITKKAKIKNLHGQEKGRKMLKAEEKQRMMKLTDIVNKHAPKASKHLRLPEIFEEVKKELNPNAPEVNAEYCIVPSKEDEYSLNKPVLLIRLESKGKEKYLEFSGQQIIDIGEKNLHDPSASIRQELGELLSEEIIELVFKSLDRHIKLVQGKPNSILKRNDNYVAAFSNDGKNIRIYDAKRIEHLIKKDKEGERLNVAGKLHLEGKYCVGEIDRLFNYGGRQIIVEAKAGGIKSSQIHALKMSKLDPIRSLFSQKKRKTGLILFGKKDEIYLRGKLKKGSFSDLAEDPYFVPAQFPFDSLPLEKCDSQLKVCKDSEFSQLINDTKK
ncbi:hypothetical protein HY643_01725, partial [Candidatus Woesearchaeota archaeon]|nr:hypothetical protein [Candidatus Woesearchaeota archaeon]